MRIVTALKSRRAFGVGAAVLALVLWKLPAAQAQTLSFDFEKNTQGWKAIPSPGGAAATVSVSRESSGDSAGQQVLQVSYRVEKGKVAGVVRKVDGLGGAGVRLRLKTDVPTVVVVGVVEKDGSSYHHIVHTGADEWQLVEVGYEDFTLADDSKDENGHLDPDEVRMLVIADAAGFMSDASVDRRRLSVDDYAVVSTLSPRAAPTAVHFRFESGVDGWMPIPAPGGAKATLGVVNAPSADSTPQPGKALEIRFRVEKSKAAGAVRAVEGLAGWGLRVRLRTDAPTMLVVGLIEQDGSTYHTIVRTGGEQWEEVEASFESFSLSDDSKDENEQLDLNQVRTLLIADAAGFISDESGTERAVWVADFEIITAPSAADHAR